MLKTIFPKKAFTSFGSSNFRKNKAMGSLMERPELKKALQTSHEKEDFFNALEKFGKTGDRGFTQRELKPMLKELENNHTDHLTNKDVYNISHALMNRRTGKYIPPTPPSTPVTPPKKTGWL
jgi:hypothetical protein